MRAEAAASPSSSVYPSAYLDREARALVRGLGKFDGWELVVHAAGSIQLRAYFFRNWNPLRPKAQQAREVHTLTL